MSDMTAIDYDALETRLGKIADGRLAVQDQATVAAISLAAIRALRAALAESERDAGRYRSCRYAALAANTDPIINTMRDWPDVTTPEEFDVQADKIVEAMAAQEKAK